MAKKQKKPTNKAKYSLYLDQSIMDKVEKQATKEDRSINYVVERTLRDSFV